MSSHIDDFAAAALIASGQAPGSVNANTNGSTVDLINADGPCFAIQQVGDVTGDTSLTGHIEQSADGTTWAAISGATFTPVTDSGDIQVIRFNRSSRYVRWVATITGTDHTAKVAVLIGEQRKTI